ncbi:hypothetical protein [Priestia abyssalis]|uniref:hypothetical protein n=1 Tax=Priestia abyssalis TaxID=1221450 RepID=UPI001475B2B2|nr:hypothetical protein [Priestia abyssalis]
MKIGTNVIFKGKNYTVRWLYDNGTCEIKKQDALGKVELVSFSELKIFEKTIRSC